MSMRKKERRYWSEKKQRRERKLSRGTVSVRSTPPLWWSSASLTCHLPSLHELHRNCLERKWKWSNSNASTILLDNQQQILFHPRVSSSTQVILADRPLPWNGKHYWQIFMPAVYGTSIMFGIATKQQQLSSENFVDLIGIDQHGWGLSHHGCLWHNGISRSYLSKPLEPLQPVLVGLEFNADARTLSYTINNQPMGIAFHSIPNNRPIYPAVSSTSAQSTMILKHTCQICSSLRTICLKLLKSNGSFDRQSLPYHLLETVT